MAVAPRLRTVDQPRRHEVTLGFEEGASRHTSKYLPPHTNRPVFLNGESAVLSDVSVMCRATG